MGELKREDKPWLLMAPPHSRDPGYNQKEKVSGGPTFISPLPCWRHNVSNYLTLLPPCLPCHHGLSHQTMNPSRPFLPSVTFVRYFVTVVRKVNNAHPNRGNRIFYYTHGYLITLMAGAMRTLSLTISHSAFCPQYLLPVAQWEHTSITTPFPTPEDASQCTIASFCRCGSRFRVVQSELAPAQSTTLAFRWQNCGSNLALCLPGSDQPLLV